MNNNYIELKLIAERKYHWLYAYHHEMILQTVQTPGDKVTVELGLNTGQRRHRQHLSSFDFGELIDQLIQLCQIDLT